MARRRRRRQGSEETLPTALDEAGFSDDAPEGDAGVTAPERVSDNSCLIHPSHDVDGACDGCQGPLCPMCAVELPQARLCAECAAERVLGGERTAAPWRGAVAVVLAMVAIGAALAPYTLFADPGAVVPLPWGRTGLVTSALLGGVGAVASGASAQDFGGLDRRAGAVGAIMGAVVLLVAVALSASKALGFFG